MLEDPSALRSILGYVVGFSCAVLAALAGLVVFLPLGAVPIRFAKQTSLLLGSLAGGFAAAWAGDGILRLFGLRAEWPFFSVLLLVFLVIEAGHASARRLPLTVSIVAQVTGLALGWWMLPR
jgi:hypothetical protein